MNTPRRSADIAIVGAGPAGRALAHRAEGAGLDVVVVDPRAHRPWRSTYAAWSDELPEWLGTQCVAASVEAVACYTPRRRTVARGYTVLDPGALRDTLTIDGVLVVEQRAAELRSDSVRLADGSAIHAGVVIDARGQQRPGRPNQTAYGVFVTAAQGARVLGSDAAILMDWRGTPPDAVASFLYAVPVGPDRVLLEETCLAGHPASGVDELRQRLHRRLAGHGLTELTPASSDVERVNFALVGEHERPWRAVPVPFGSIGGMMHPATGYNVAASLRLADTVVDSVRRGTDPGGDLWPRRARHVHRLRARGLNSVLGLDSRQTREFFDAFFAMPIHRQRAYLSDRCDIAGVLAAMGHAVARADPTLAKAVAAGARRPTGPLYSVPG